MEVKNCHSDQAELSDIATDYRNLSYLKIASPVSRIPHLTNADSDHNMPSEFNFNYYSTHDFHSNHDIYESSLDSRSFSALHCNIRSLQGNYDNLAQLCCPNYSFLFQSLEVSETKFMTNKDILTNLDLPGYDFISQPSLSNAGGVGFYVKII